MTKKVLVLISAVIILIGCRKDRSITYLWLQISVAETNVTSRTFAAHGYFQFNGQKMSVNNVLCYLSENEDMSDALIYPTSYSIIGDGYQGEFRVNINNLKSSTKYYYKIGIDGGYGVHDGHFGWFKTDALTGNEVYAFSVSDSKQVFFSSRNLLYNTSTNTWDFTDNPWDYCFFDANRKDLFGWGTGNNPTNISNDNANYRYYYEWGDNMVLYDANMNLLHCRTLNKDEWTYVLHTRNTASGIRFAYATVNGTDGLIILPDGWNKDIYNFKNPNINYYDGGDFTNVISSDSWTNCFEVNGAIFLPSAGSYYGNSGTIGGYRGYYWSSTSDGIDNAYALYFYDLGGLVTRPRCCGHCVRLVIDKDW